MLKEIIESISGNIRERASSPILGSYTIAAAACNWKSLVILFTSEKKGVALVNEIISESPNLQQQLLYPLVFALVFSIFYPSIKALISTFNTGARIIELKAEYRMAELNEKIAIKKDDIESVIQALQDSYEKIGYHDLKRIHDALPNEEELLINSPNKSLQPKI